MIKFISKFNAQITQEASKQQFKKMAWFMILFSLLFIVIGAFTIKEDLFYGCFMIAIGVLFIPLCLILTKVFQKQANKSMSILNDETEQTFEFFDNYFTLEIHKGEDYSSSMRAKYNYLYKVVETKDSYLLYISKIQMHIFFKKDLVEGSIEQLNEIFKQNLSANFKSLNK